jgi:hypothetical protein
MVEDALAKLCNHVAHPSGHHVDTPVGAARTVRDLTELINQLWGQATPGGACIRRLCTGRSLC